MKWRISILQAAQAEPGWAPLEKSMGRWDWMHGDMHKPGAAYAQALAPRPPPGLGDPTLVAAGGLLAPAGEPQAPAGGLPAEPAALQWLKPPNRWGHAPHGMRPNPVQRHGPRPIVVPAVGLT